MTTEGPPPEAARNELWSGAYAELRHLASRHIRRQSYRTLSTTTLVHEAFLRVAGTQNLEFQDRDHYLRIASRAMRWILVDEVRERLQKKRGGGWLRIDLEDAKAPAMENAAHAEQALQLARAIEKLAEIDGRGARVVALRGLGMRMEEIALELGVSERTVTRDWNHAVSWLNRALADPDS